MMVNNSVDVLLQFPAMSAPVRIEVSFPQLRILDLYGERTVTPDGTAIYRLRQTNDRPESSDSPAGQYMLLPV